MDTVWLVMEVDPDGDEFVVGVAKSMDDANVLMLEYSANYRDVLGNRTYYVEPYDLYVRSSN